MTKLDSLRAWMREHKLYAYIFPSTDPHAGEYVPDHWKTREWISGFNGSAGTAVVTIYSAALWTDSRYWLAAEEQLAGTPFQVIRCSRNAATPEEIEEWIANDWNEVGRNHFYIYQAVGVNYFDTRIGLDGWCNSTEFVRAYKKVCRGVVVTDLDPTAELWTDRPALPSAPIEIQPLEFAGRTVAQKLKDVKTVLQKNRCDSLIVSQLDEIAWLLNLRGSDVHCTPVFVAYLLVHWDKTHLFVDPTKVTPEVKDYLEKNKVEVHTYNEVTAMLKHDSDILKEHDYLGIAADLSTLNYALFEACDNCVDIPSPIAPLRAIKNEAEIEGFRQAMLRDGIAMVKFLKALSPRSWSSSTASSGSVDGGFPVVRTLPPPPKDAEQTWSEVSVDKYLTSLRAEQPGFRGLSFDTIAGYGPHAAIVHYEATPETDVPLEPHGLLLLDSGGQYDCGTTDITRTIALGTLTDEERRDYTLVLKGHIRLATAVFPDGTSGTQLDVLARYAMWQDHKNYGHGTGHGVGSYLSVHEGPHQFRMNWMPAPLHANMTVTIEPGIYIAGSHGCRIENTMLIVEDTPTLNCQGSTVNSPWLRLEPLTLCPIDTAPIVREMMLDDEIQYLNNYHARVREALLPLLKDEEERQWLIAATAPL